MSATAALAALEQAMKQKQAPKSGGLKRSSQSSTGSLRLREFEQASEEFGEDSVTAFPNIEWSFNEDESDVFSFEPPAKRSCNGLLRSKGSADLSSLRCGSAGSLY